VYHDGNIQQSFATLPLKTNGQKNRWVHMTKYYPIQQSSGMSPSGVYQQSLLELDTPTGSMMEGIKQSFS
jgi:hypothetical protein